MRYRARIRVWLAECVVSLRRRPAGCVSWCIVLQSPLILSVCLISHHLSGKSILNDDHHTRSEIALFLLHTVFGALKRARSCRAGLLCFVETGHACSICGEGVTPGQGASGREQQSSVVTGRSDIVEVCRACNGGG